MAVYDDQVKQEGDEKQGGFSANVSGGNSANNTSGSSKPSSTSSSSSGSNHSLNFAPKKPQAPTVNEGTSSSGAKSLKQSETEATGASLYNSESSSNSFFSRARSSLWGTRRRKQATTAGGITSVVFVGAFVGLGFLSGTGFEFVHLAQLLEHAHFSDQQSASDQEMGKLYRFINSGGNKGETRLSYLESKYKNRMIAQLNDKGLNLTTDKKGNVVVEVDTEKEGTPYYGMNDDQIKATLESQGITETSIENGNVTIAPDSNFLDSAKQGKLTMAWLVNDLNESKIPDAIRMRILAKFSLINWHPLFEIKSVVNGKINNTAIEAGKKLWKTANDKWKATGQTGADDITSGAKEDENGKIEPSPGTDGVQTDSSVKATLSALRANKGFKVGAGVTGAVATGLGLVCTIHTIANNIGDIRYVQDIEPMMRLGSEVVTTGNQIMDGTDVDANEMSVMAQQFTNAKGQNWADAQTIQADSGQPVNGKNINSGVYGALQNNLPSWLSWANSPPIPSVCSQGAQIVTGVVSFTLGLFSGDTLGLIGGIVLQYTAVPNVINNISKLVAGDAVNVVTASGPDFGNYADYGSRYFANTAAMQDGGVALSNKQVAILNNENNTASQQQFDSHGLAYRVFNPDDYRSLVSRAMDSQSSSVGSNINNVASDIMNVATYLFTSPTKLLSVFTPLAKAATPTTYTYPDSFPQVGFSAAELNSPLVANPYDNAEYVATHYLDKNNLPAKGNQPATPDYITYIKNCFNDGVQKDSNGNWDVVPGANSDPIAYNMYTESPNDPYAQQNCQDPSGVDPDAWLRIRFFVFDTSVMEGYTCQQGDDQSCQNDGINTANSSSTAATSNGAYFVGDSLMVGMQQEGQLTPDLTTAGWKPLQIEATVGDTINDAQPKIQNDAANIKSAGVIVIGLGTNDYTEPESTIEQEIQSTISEIKVINPNAKLYWINTYSNKLNMDNVNTAITNQASSQGYQVIDWNKEVTNNPGKYTFDSSIGVHLDANGYALRSAFVVNSLGKAP